MTVFSYQNNYLSFSPSTATPPLGNMSKWQRESVSSDPIITVLDDHLSIVTLIGCWFFRCLSTRGHLGPRLKVKCCWELVGNKTSLWNRHVDQETILSFFIFFILFYPQLWFSLSASGSLCSPPSLSFSLPPSPLSLSFTPSYNPPRPTPIPWFPLLLVRGQAQVARGGGDGWGVRSLQTQRHPQRATPVTIVPAACHVWAHSQVTSYSPRCLGLTEHSSSTEGQDRWLWLKIPRALKWFMF